jgi:phosphatidylglycerol:prolipoprotein diacylglycerol transferase
VRKLNWRRALDVAAFGAALGLSVGRIGDLINGEHFSKVSDLPWAVRYTNLNSPSVLAENSPCGLDPTQGLDTSQLCAQHPAVGYEMLGLLIVFGLLFLVLRLAKRDGVTFFSFLLIYALMRFGLSELRLDSRTVIAGLTTPQVTSLGVIPIALAGLAYCWLRPAGAPEGGAPAVAAAASAPG